MVMTLSQGIDISTSKCNSYLDKFTWTILPGQVCVTAARRTLLDMQIKKMCNENESKSFYTSSFVTFSMQTKFEFLKNTQFWQFSQSLGWQHFVCLDSDTASVMLFFSTWSLESHQNWTQNYKVFMKYFLILFQLQHLQKFYCVLKKLCKLISVYM